MREFLFYATKADREGLLRALLAQPGIMWFCSRLYDSPAPQLLSAESLSLVASSDDGQFYGLTIDSGSQPEMTVVASGAAMGRWVIDAIQSPPMLALGLPFHYNDGNERLRAGNLYFPAAGSTHSSKKADLLKTVYADVIRRLKNTAISSKKIEGRNVWLTSEAARRLEEGAFVMIGGRWVGGANPDSGET